MLLQSLDSGDTKNLPDESPDAHKWMDCWGLRSLCISCTGSKQIASLGCLAALNFLAVVVFQTVLTCLVPLDCQTYTGGGEDDCGLNYTPFVLYFEPVYLATAAYTTYFVSCSALPPLPWYVPISVYIVTTLMSVTILLSVGPEEATRDPTILSIGVYLFQPLYLGLALCWAKFQFSKYDDDKAEHLVTADVVSIVETKAIENKVVMGNDAQEIAHGPELVKDSADEECSWDTHRLADSICVQWVGYYKPKPEVRIARIRAWKRHAIASVWMAGLGLSVFFAGVYGAQGFQRKRGLWASATFVGFVLAIVNFIATKAAHLIPSVVEMDIEALGFDYPSMVAYFFDLVYFVFYRIVQEQVGDFSALAGLISTRFVFDFFVSTARYFPCVWVIEYRLNKFFYPNWKKSQEQARIEAFGAAEAQLGARSLADISAIFISLAALFLFSFGPVYTRRSFNRNSTPKGTTTLLVGITVDLASQLFISIMHKVFFGISAYKIWYSALLANPAHAVITTLLSLHVAGDVLFYFLDLRFV